MRHLAEWFAEYVSTWMSIARFISSSMPAFRIALEVVVVIRLLLLSDV